MRIWLQKSASIQPRTSSAKFARSPCTDLSDEKRIELVRVHEVLRILPFIWPSGLRVERPLSSYLPRRGSRLPNESSNFRFEERRCGER